METEWLIISEWMDAIPTNTYSLRKNNLKVVLGSIAYWYNGLFKSFFACLFDGYRIHWNLFQMVFDNLTRMRYYNLTSLFYKQHIIWSTLLYSLSSRNLQVGSSICIFLLKCWIIYEIISRKCFLWFKSWTQLPNSLITCFFSGLFLLKQTINNKLMGVEVVPNLRETFDSPASNSRC